MFAYAAWFIAGAAAGIGLLLCLALKERRYKRKALEQKLEREREGRRRMMCIEGARYRAPESIQEAMMN